MQGRSNFVAEFNPNCLGKNNIAAYRLHLLTNDFDQREMLRITVGSVVEHEGHPEAKARSAFVDRLHRLVGLHLLFFNILIHELFNALVKNELHFVAMQPPGLCRAK